MNGEEVSSQNAARERKREAGRQITRDGEEGADDAPTAESTARAPPEVLAQRRILRVRRPTEAATPPAVGAFAGLTSATPTVPPKVQLVTTGFGQAPGTPPSRPADVPLPNPFAFGKAAGATAAAHSPPAPAPTATASVSAPSSLNAKPNADAVPKVFGGSAFKFSFTAPPPPSDAPAPVTAAAQQVVQLSPVEESEDPNTKALFHETLSLYQFADKEWKERGDVSVKIAVNQATSQPWAMLLASAVKTHRSVVKAAIGPGFKLGKRADRQVTFACVADDAPATFLVRAPKNQDARIDAFTAAVAKAQAAVAEQSQ